MKIFMELAKEKVNFKRGKFLKKKKGDDKLIVTIALCVIGSALVLLFKDSMGPILSGLLTQVQTAIKGMF